MMSDGGGSNFRSRMEVNMGLLSRAVSLVLDIPEISSRSRSSSRKVSKLNTLTWLGLSPAPMMNPSLMMYSGGSSMNLFSTAGSTPIPKPSIENALPSSSHIIRRRLSLWGGATPLLIRTHIPFSRPAAFIMRPSCT